MMLTLSELYNRYDGRPPKHLLEAARTGKSQIQLAIDTLRRQARWNMGKARDWVRAARLAKAFAHPERVAMLLGDARFHRDCARRQYRQAERLEAQERDVQERAA